MQALPLAVFVATYLGLALGRIPGLKLDRAGIAILGAAVLLGAEVMPLSSALQGVDAPTLIVLFGLMLLSAQYRLAGLYAAIARRVAGVQSPRALLGAVMLASGALSAVLTNDVVCFAVTPVVAASVLAAGLPPIPYLVGIACASNIGSALTPIGNPQNILIAQRMGLSFLPFVGACAVPVLASLVVAFLVLSRGLPRLPAGPRAAALTLLDSPAPVDRYHAAKAVALTAAAVAMFMTSVPPYVTCLGVAGFVLASRRFHTRELLALVDWPLLALFGGLFVVGHAFQTSGWLGATQAGLAELGVDPARPGALLLTAPLLSLVVSNVPAVMLMLPLVDSQAATGHLLALASTFAGNAVLVGSVANLIVVEQARAVGVRVGFGDHVRYGLPVTAASLFMVWLWSAL